MAFLTRTPTAFVLSALACGERHEDERGCTYQVRWSINPHMKVGAIDLPRARAQAEILRRALVREGARVVELPFVHGAFDSVFTKDAALLVRRPTGVRALLANQRFEVRRRERAARASALEALGIDLAEGPSVPWEGGDVVLLHDEAMCLLGCGQRSDRSAAGWLARELRMPVVVLDLVDPRLFHLDMALSVLPTGSLLVCEEALSPSSMRTLRTLLRKREIVSVPLADALAFGLNLVPVGDAVIMGSGAPRVEATLRARGLRPVPIDLDQFQLAGGSAACLVARVHDPSVGTASANTHSAVA